MLTPKYNIGDRVYLVHWNNANKAYSVECKRIDSILIEKDGISYGFWCWYRREEEYNVFHSEDEAWDVALANNRA